MFLHVPALAANSVSVSGSNLTWVIIVAVVGLLALGVAGALVREVLAASTGTSTTSASRRTRTALTVTSSGSPGPTPTPIRRFIGRAFSVWEFPVREFSRRRR